MKRVILIGDSIRMGYQDVVRRELENEAEVWGPTQNGGNSQNVLDHLQEWVIDPSPDVVHMNCGLHDLKTPFDSDTQTIALDAYESNVRQILTQLGEKTQATVVWAATTPVNQQWHHENKDFDRFEAHVAAYNAAAGRVAAELGVEVNDLFSVVMQAGRDRHLRPDGVHFTEEGSELLGKAVADFVRGLGA